MCCCIALSTYFSQSDTLLFFVIALLGHKKDVFQSSFSHKFFNNSQERKQAKNRNHSQSDTLLYVDAMLFRDQSECILEQKSYAPSTFNLQSRRLYAYWHYMPVSTKIGKLCAGSGTVQHREQNKDVQQ